MKMFPEELNERYHAAATHVSNLIRAQNRLANPFNFSQDRVIVVVRPVAATFFSLFLPFLFVCLFAFTPVCLCGVKESRERDKQSQRQDAAAVAPKRLRGRKESARVSNEREGESRGSDRGGGRRRRRTERERKTAM